MTTSRGLTVQKDTTMKPGISKVSGAVVAFAFALGAGACGQIAGLTGNYSEATDGGAGDCWGDRCGATLERRAQAARVPAGGGGASSGGGGSSTGGSSTGGSSTGGSSTGGSSTGGSSTGGSSTGGSSTGGSSTGGSAGTSSGGGAGGAGGSSVIPVCGNGVVEPAAGETCDDGNTTAGDGCSATCADGSGFVRSVGPRLSATQSELQRAREDLRPERQRRLLLLERGGRHHKRDVLPELQTASRSGYTSQAHARRR